MSNSVRIYHLYARIVLFIMKYHSLRLVLIPSTHRLDMYGLRTMHVRLSLLVRLTSQRHDTQKPFAFTDDLVI